MKVAVLAPSPIPFVIGGVEHSTREIVQAINNTTEHIAELFKVPTREHSFWELVDSYEMYYNMDLDHFDMVIVTKYPAWMIRHKNLVCFTYHKLRGLYDTYHFMNLPEKTKSDPQINKVLELIRSNYFDSDALFYELNKLRGCLKDEFLSFPGPFIREIIHYLDDCAYKNVNKFYSLSNTVKARENYFPKNINVETVYIPSHLKALEPSGYDYFFTVSRLDSPKRIEMLINAYKKVDSDIKFLIAGSGPQKAYLEDLAKEDSRIKFLGYVNDEDLSDLYSGCRAVLYCPYEEDYGLITYEAMSNKKLVITTKDSGGPTEFIEENKNGFSANSNISSLATKIQLIADNEDLAISMGEYAFDSVKYINWKYVAKKLTSNNSISTSESKFMILSTYNIYPPMGGGQLRIYNIAKNLGLKSKVDIISLAGNRSNDSNVCIEKNVVEHIIAKSEEHTGNEWNIEKEVGIPVTDFAAIKLMNQTPSFADCMKKHFDKNTIVLLEQPYLYYQINSLGEDIPFVYSSQNVEYIMKQDMLPDNQKSKEIMKWLYEVEKLACERSKFITCCSKEDKERMVTTYGINKNKIHLIPNGVDTSIVQFTKYNQRLKNKFKSGLGNEKIAIFIGSWHQPNIEATFQILNIAKQLPQVKFLIAGSQCLYFERNKISIPENVAMLGIIENNVKDKLFSCVDLALNPMITGSGTNLKMFDYMSAGIPIVTTNMGSRGIEDKSNFFSTNIENFANEISRVLTLPKVELNNLTYGAREFVVNNFDWKVIVKEYKRLLNSN